MITSLQALSLNAMMSQLPAEMTPEDEQHWQDLRHCFIDPQTCMQICLTIFEQKKDLRLLPYFSNNYLPHIPSVKQLGKGTLTCDHIVKILLEAFPRLENLDLSD